jgi:transcriptional regulator
MANPFTPRKRADVTDLVRAFPLCWLVSGGPGERFATPLPLLPETDSTGAVRALFGHFGRANPHVAALERSPSATILCMGANGYITPRLVSKPGWAPTWNYAVTRFEADVRFVPEENDAALTQLAAALEDGADEPWTPARMGARYDQLSQHIIAFRAVIRSEDAKFKLGQDEDEATFEEIVAGLPDRTLANWMRRTRD